MSPIHGRCCENETEYAERMKKSLSGKWGGGSVKHNRYLSGAGHACMLRDGEVQGRGVDYQADYRRQDCIRIVCTK